MGHRHRFSILFLLALLVGEDGAIWRTGQDDESALV